MFQEWETYLCFNAPYNPKDNARIVKQMFQEWETYLCFNAPYNPKDKPAELVIVMVKKFVRI